MPPRPPIPKTVKCVVTWQNTAAMGGQANNILYVSSPGSADTVSAADCLTIATGLGGTSTSNGFRRLLSSVAGNWKLMSVTAQDLGGSEDQGTYTINAAGTNSNPPLSPQSAVCLSWGISARYRGGKPRTYLPGLTQAILTAVGSSQIASINSAPLAAIGNEIINDVALITIASLTCSLGTVSYFTGGAPRVTPVFRSYGSCVVHDRLDSQRRRSGKERAFSID